MRKSGERKEEVRGEERKSEAKKEEAGKGSDLLAQPLPPLSTGSVTVEGKSKLSPLPAIEKSPAKEEKKIETEKSKPSEDSTDKERNDLKEIDEKLEKFTAGIKIDNKPKLAPVAGITKIPYEEEKSEYTAHNL